MVGNLAEYSIHRKSDGTGGLAVQEMVGWTRFFHKRYVESKSFDICIGHSMWKLTVIAKIPFFMNRRLLNQPCYIILVKIIINIVAMFNITMQYDTAIKRRRILTYDNVTNDNDHINDSKATVVIIIKIVHSYRVYSLITSTIPAVFC